MHETYMWPFANAVRAGTASIMCSYQRLNGSYGCQNSKTLNGLLKTELGFQGYVVSDWYAVGRASPKTLCQFEAEPDHCRPTTHPSRRRCRVSRRLRPGST